MTTEGNQHDSSQEEDPLSSMGSKANNHLSSDTLDSIQFIARLLHLQQTLDGQSQGALETFCREIELASHQRAQLILFRKQSKPARVPKSWHGFAVEANGRSYGRLYFAPDPARPTDPVVPFPTARLVADFCAFFLYSLEIAVLSRGNGALSASSASPSFTPREKDVLELLCRGYDLQAIAGTLHIARSTASQYLREVYAGFHVKNEREAVFAAFSAGLFFPLEDLSPKIVQDVLST